MSLAKANFSNGRRIALAGGLAVFAALAAAAPASATTGVAVGDNALQIADATGDDNALDIGPGVLGYDVQDDHARLAAGTGCLQVGVHRVACAGMILKLSVAAGNGDDIVLLHDVTVPAAIDAGAGDDLVDGGGADDQLDGGSGDDTVLGEGGDDAVSGAAGGDLLEGAAGADAIAGGPGADILQGQAGNQDVLSGGDGPDLLEGGSGDDVLKGGPGSDVLVTGTGADSASTGTGDDRVFGTTADTVACQHGDAVRTGTSAPPDGCARLPADARVPEAWPPPRDFGEIAAGSAALGARAAIIELPKPIGVFKARVVSHGNARKIAVRLGSAPDQLVNVLVRPRDRKGHKLPPFKATVHTWHAQPLENESGPAAWSVRVKCCL
jgi:hypothetical protein